MFLITSFFELKYMYFLKGKVIIFFLQAVYKNGNKDSSVAVINFAMPVMFKVLKLYNIDSLSYNTLGNVCDFLA